MRIYQSLLAGAAGTLSGFAATLIVHDGWQPVAAAVSIFGGILLLLSFIALGVLADQPRSDRPESASGGPRQAPARRRGHAALSASLPRSASSPPKSARPPDRDRGAPRRALPSRVRLNGRSSSHGSLISQPYGRGDMRNGKETGNAIEARNLVKGYKGVPVLHDVSFTVARGTVFALLGANGSGKTTTINLLTTLIKADGGTASIAGFDVTERPSRVREQISLTGQFAAVDDVLTARENLVLMGELRHVADPGRTAAELLAKFDLGEAADRRLMTFSGGMRRRLDIAMSLVGDAPIIFLDEPTTGLDPMSRTDMWLTIRQLVETGTTVFLTTQYLDEADRLADEIAILHGGRIVAGGTPDELKDVGPTGLVELEFGDEEQLAAARRALGEQHEINRVDSKLVVSTSGSAAEMADMFIRLKDSGIEPTGFSRQLPTLDDAFFRILDEDREDRYASTH
jgi:ABC-2 type transport system ATP-binding protein